MTGGTAFAATQNCPLSSLAEKGKCASYTEWTGALRPSRTMSGGDFCFPPKSQ